MLQQQKRIRGGMLEEHSPGLITASVVSVVVYFFGLVVNVSSLAMQYTSSATLMQEILREGVSNASSSYVLPVSLADWSAAVWGVVFVCQFFWLTFALTGIFRQTSLGPVYNNPKILPVQVHFFFSLAILTQVGWLLLMDRNYLAFALLLALLSTGCSVISLCESYRALLTAQPMLMQEARSVDLWAVRLLAHNALALFVTWITLHTVLTFALFLAFGMDHLLTTTNASLVELCIAGFLVFFYVLVDLTVCDKYSRYVLLPYVGCVVFHSSQINKDWPRTDTVIFGLLAGLTAFTFLCVLVKVIVLLCRHMLQREKEKVVVTSHPLAAELEEETYLLRHK